MSMLPLVMEQMPASPTDALALSRFGQHIDIGNAVAWLCSEAASFVTGTTIHCDGGMRLGNLYAPGWEPGTIKE